MSMQEYLRGKNIVWWGWISGWLFLAALFALTTLIFLSGVRQADLPMDYVNAVQGILYGVTFLIFLLGIRGFAVEKQDSELTKTLNTLLIVNVLEMIIMTPYMFPRFFYQDFLTLLLVAAIFLLCINGIVLLRLADGFSKYSAELGVNVKRVVWSNRIAGWMLASIVLFIPGFFAALLGEFFLWRFLASRVRSQELYVPLAEAK